MTHKELKKILRKAGIGGMFGTGIRLFDGEFTYPSVDDAKDRARNGMAALAKKGFVPSRDYAEFIADCDGASKWLQAEVTFGWFLDHKGVKSFPAYPFGTAVVPGHAFNLCVTDSGLLFWDYGELFYPDAKTIKEVEMY